MQLKLGTCIQSNLIKSILWVAIKLRKWTKLSYTNEFIGRIEQKLKLNWNQNNLKVVEPVNHHNFPSGLVLHENYTKQGISWIMNLWMNSIATVLGYKK